MGLQLQLQKGQSTTLKPDENGNLYYMLGLGWDAATQPGVEFDLDVAAIVRDANGLPTQDDDVCYFNQLNVSWAKLSGDSRGGEGQIDATGDDERLWLDLSKVRPEGKSIDILVTIYEGAKRKQTFGDVQKGAIRLVVNPTFGVKDGEEKARIEVTASELFDVDGICFVQFTRRGSGWTYKYVALTDQNKYADLGTAINTPSLPA